MKSLVFAVLVAGCGGSDFVPTLEINAPGATLVAAQSGDGPWLQVPIDEQGHGEVPIDAGYYGVAVFCAGEPPHIVLDTAAAPLTYRCPATAATTVRISGPATPGSDIYIGPHHVTVGTEATYAIDLVPSVYDIIATTGVAGFALYNADLSRDLEVDVTASSALVENEVAVTGGDASGVVVASYASSGTTHALIYAGPPPALGLPFQLQGSFTEGFRQTFAATAHGCTAQDVSGAPLVIPAEMTATADRTQATWSAAHLDWQYLDVDVTGTAAMTIRARMRWFEKRGIPDTLPAIDPATFEGWSPELGGAFPPADPVTMNLQLSLGALNEKYTSCSVAKTFAW
jgi:hypothetical protein